MTKKTTPTSKVRSISLLLVLVLSSNFLVEAHSVRQTPRRTGAFDLIEIVCSFIANDVATSDGILIVDGASFSDSLLASKGIVIGD